jgi:hypothetical protein
MRRYLLVAEGKSIIRAGIWYRPGVERTARIVLAGLGTE